MSDLEELTEAVKTFNDEREWGAFHDPKSLALALMGEVGELAELVQWLPAQTSTQLARTDPLRTRIGEELSDILIYLVQLAEICEIDLADAAPRKLAAAALKYPPVEFRGRAPERE